MEQLIYDRTQLDVDLDTEKGSYNFTDLKRIENWCQYLSKILNSYNYNNIINVKTDWAMVEVMTTENSPIEAQMERIRQNLITLRNVFFALSTTPATPENLDFMTFKKANDVEKILFDIEKVIKYMENNFIYCGVANCGQSRVWQQRFRKYNFELYTFKNLIKNGGFENADGWVANKDTALYSTNDGTLTITANPTETKYIWINTTNKIPLISEHKYYCAVDCNKSGGGTTSWAMYNTSTSVSYWSSEVANETNGFKRLSKYYTASGSGETNFMLYGITYKWSVDFVVKWDNLVVVDLTATFGAGNEPTQEWCDNNISYFVGEKTIHKIKEDEK